jgi:hypothetical protein
MITVSIFINNNPILTRSAVNTGEVDSEGNTLYKVDTGEILKHKRKDRAVVLAHKMLDTIKEI